MIIDNLPLFCLLTQFQPQTYFQHAQWLTTHINIRKGLKTRLTARFFTRFASINDQSPVYQRSRHVYYGHDLSSHLYTIHATTLCLSSHTIHAYALRLMHQYTYLHTYTMQLPIPYTSTMLPSIVYQLYYTAYIFTTIHKYTCINIH